MVQKEDYKEKAQLDKERYARELEEAGEGKDGDASDKSDEKKKKRNKRKEKRPRRSSSPRGRPTPVDGD